MSFLTNPAKLKLGEKAPKINALDETGTAIHLADYYQKGPTLIYFYPKADTPGCTKQACGLRDSFASLQARGLQIIGVSNDKPGSQKKFKEKHKLPFLLLADHAGEVAKAFGVPTIFGFAKRQSFLVDNGKIVWSDLSVSASTHVSNVNDALDALNK